MTKGKHTGRYRLGLNSIFVPDSSPFQNLTICTYNYIIPKIVLVFYLFFICESTKYTYSYMSIYLKYTYFYRNIYSMIISTLKMSICSNVSEQDVINLCKLAEQQ